MTALVVTFLGGVGLFLLGMKLMTDGLKVAAGDALRDILARGTATTGRGILSGVLITALVQSSTAVTIASIGFVNAGLMSLYQSVGVIIGANIGTTTTSWLVAVVGFQVDIRALAMPAIALGMALRITGAGTRRGALGEAIAGFGIFFLGIDVLRESFAGVEERFDLERFAGGGLAGLLLSVAIGIVLTVLMNSSSAALAVTLTAAGGGLIPLEAAAAMVIGANIGTTSTALLAVIGATSNARRSAVAHVFFNLVTGVVAFSVLPFLLLGGATLARALGLEPGPATVLAIFHTATKLTGTAVVWPLTPWLVRWLEARFRTADEDLGRPRHLDRNVAGTPSLALEALARELARIGDLARRAAASVISAEEPPGPWLDRDKAVVDRLVLAVGEFCSEATRNADMPEPIAAAFADGLRVTQYYDDMLERALEIRRWRRGETRDAELAEAMSRFKGQAVSLIGRADADREGFHRHELAEAHRAVEEAYQELKHRLLFAGTAGRLPVRHMVARLDELSAIRRILDQATKAAYYTHRLHAALGGREAQGEEEAPPAADASASRPGSE